jgi:type I restriction enzyme S subunit
MGIDLEKLNTGTSVPQINHKDIAPLFFPVPPIAEQHRIISKVDELMLLCDQLERQQTNTNESHQTLVDILLGTLTNAENPAAFEEAWQRIANHFDTLLTTEHSIDQLKQTILQLSVMGKLVPQNPDDEPASELLKKIAKEKARLGKEGKLQKHDSIHDITFKEKLFELPEGWKLARLGLIGIGSTGKTPSTNISKYFGGRIPFIGPGQITPKREIIDSDTFLTDEGCSYSTIADLGDIIMVCIGGSIGKSAIVKSKIAFNQQLNCIRPVIVEPSYLYVAMNAPYFQSSILISASGSATPIINRSKWEELPIPLPPLAEQRLIVTKVDELFALCDALKEQLRDAQALQNQLAVAVVEQGVKY